MSFLLDAKKRVNECGGRVTTERRLEKEVAPENCRC